MVDHWLDTNIFIESKNNAYAFDIAPGFWEQLVAHAANGVIGIPSIVFDELVAQHEDELTTWIRQHQAAFCVAPNAAIQNEYRGVADYVSATYDIRVAIEFLGKADSWLVAYASATGGTVATFEKRDTSSRWRHKKIKIPNVCAEFGVTCVDRNELVRRLGISLK